MHKRSVVPVECLDTEAKQTPGVSNAHAQTIAHTVVDDAPVAKCDRCPRSCGHGPKSLTSGARRWILFWGGCQSNVRACWYAHKRNAVTSMIVVTQCVRNACMHTRAWRRHICTASRRTQTNIHTSGHFFPQNRA